MKRIGIYSGAFDPVHIGHVGFALRSLEAAELDEVVFLPERVPRDKPRVTDIEHRFAMIQCSIEPYQQLSVRLLDVPQFCVRGTMPVLRDMFGDDELVFLLGSDMVRTFADRWPELDDLFEAMPLVIGVRDGDSAKQLKRELRAVSGRVRPRYQFVDSPLSLANSTRVRDDHVIRDVDPSAYRYIREHHLYGWAG